MFFLLGGNSEKKARKAERKQHRKMGEMTDRAREIFMAGRFPVVTTDEVEGRRIAKVLGLVCCRGFDSEEAFFSSVFIKGCEVLKTDDLCQHGV